MWIRTHTALCTHIVFQAGPRNHTKLQPSRTAHNFARCTFRICDLVFHGYVILNLTPHVLLLLPPYDVLLSQTVYQ